MDSPGPTVRIKERGPRGSSFGEVLQLKVWADGYPNLFWEQIQAAFAAAYPGRYAVQLFPPPGRVVNGKAVYHLWVLPEAPRGLDLREGE
jgi:hypothetical protein